MSATDNGVPQRLTVPAGQPAWLWWAAAVGLALLLAVPLLATKLPPMGDYLNHLARMYVIIHIRTDPVLARIYEVDWNIVPNLAMDLVVPALSHVVSLDLAGRIFIAIALLLPVAGVVALHRAAFGGRDFWPLSSLLVAYNGLFFWGFLNFVVGMGMALLGIALWLREPMRSGWRHPLSVAILALMVFICHAQALALFGVTLGCIELARLWELRRDRRLTVAAVASRGSRLAFPFILPALLFLFATSLGEELTTKPLLSQIKEYYWAAYNSWRDGKLVGLGMPFASYSPLLDGLAAAVATLLYLVQCLRHGCRTHPGLLLAVVLLLLAYPVVPSVWLTAANIDSRLLVFAVLLVLGGVAPNGAVGPAMRAGAMVFAGLLAARAMVVFHAWAVSNDGLAAFRLLIQPVAPGERVLVVSRPVPAEPMLFSRRILYNFQPAGLAPLLTMDRQAFWPALFTSRTLQPVHVAPPYRAIAVEQAETPPHTALTRPTRRDVLLNPYIVNWRLQFDYILLCPSDDLLKLESSLSAALQLMNGNDICVLYKILH